MEFGLPPGTEAHGGYWIMPLALVAGLGLLVVMQWLSRRILSWMRSRKSPARIALKVEVREQGR
jgi:prenyltransferase beta subunit